MSPSEQIYTTVIVPGSSLLTQPWWTDLHALITEAYENRKTKTNMFPPGWARLHPDPVQGGEKLSEELGPNGHFVVLFSGDKPVAGSGVLPYRGEDRVGHETDVKEDLTKSLKNDGLDDANQTFSNWELCCFCVHPAHRGQGLSPQLIDSLLNFVRSKNAEKLFVEYVEEETSGFWGKIGFKTIPGGGTVATKTYQHDHQSEPMKVNLRLGVGAMAV